MLPLHRRNVDAGWRTLCTYKWDRRHELKSISTARYCSLKISISPQSWLGSVTSDLALDPPPLSQFSSASLTHLSTGRHTCGTVSLRNEDWLNDAFYSHHPRCDAGHPCCCGASFDSRAQHRDESRYFDRLTLWDALGHCITGPPSSSSPILLRSNDGCNPASISPSGAFFTIPAYARRDAHTEHTDIQDHRHRSRWVSSTRPRLRTGRHALLPFAPQSHQEQGSRCECSGDGWSLELSAACFPKFISRRG